MAVREKRKPKSGSKSRRMPRQSNGTKSSWGGRRPGAGRPKGSGSGPSPNSRKNRIAVMFTDTELNKLQTLAAKRKLPIATIAYSLIARSLKRA